jgi:hypothetical protein
MQILLRHRFVRAGLQPCPPQGMYFRYVYSTVNLGTDHRPSQYTMAGLILTLQVILMLQIYSCPLINDDAMQLHKIYTPFRPEVMQYHQIHELFIHCFVSP